MGLEYFLVYGIVRVYETTIYDWKLENAHGR